MEAVGGRAVVGVYYWFWPSHLDRFPSSWTFPFFADVGGVSIRWASVAGCGIGFCFGTCLARRLVGCGSTASLTFCLIALSPPLVALLLRLFLTLQTPPPIVLPVLQLLLQVRHVWAITDIVKARIVSSLPKKMILALCSCVTG